MKKIFKIMLVSLVALSLAACGSKGKDSNKLVVYTAAPEDKINLTISMFEEQTGIEVELVTASTGELFSRVKQEADSPMADVLWSGTNYGSMLEYLEPYRSPNQANVSEEMTLEDERLQGTALGGVIMIVNTNIVGEGNVKGYKDLINPEYKGMIAHGDVSASSSAFGHIRNMMHALDPENPLSEDNWEYIGKFLENLDGKIVNSSGAVIQGVAAGEYAIGLTFEEGGIQSVASGAPVEVVYMEEGVISSIDQSGIIKDAPNMDNAKKFIDFLLSEEYQSVIGIETALRPIDPNAKINEYKVPYDQIKWIKEDVQWDIDNRDDVVSRYMDMWTDLE